MLEKLKVANEQAQKVNQQLTAVVKKLSQHIQQVEGYQEMRKANLSIVNPNKNRKSVIKSSKHDKDGKWQPSPLSEASSWQIMKQVLSDSYILNWAKSY